MLSFCGSKVVFMLGYIWAIMAWKLADSFNANLAALERGSECVHLSRPHTGKAAVDEEQVRLFFPVIPVKRLAATLDLLPG